MDILNSFKQTWNQMPSWLRGLFTIALVIAAFFTLLLIVTDPLILGILILVLAGFLIWRYVKI